MILHIHYNTLYRTVYQVLRSSRARTARDSFNHASGGIAPNVFQLTTLARAKKANLSYCEDSRRALMWVSEMSEASAANPDEGAEQCEATEERQLGVRRWPFCGA